MGRRGVSFLMTLLAILSGYGKVSSPAWAAGEANPSSAVTRLIASGCLAPIRRDPSAVELSSALANCPPVDPIFRIESGVNNAKVNRIAADDACSIIATASEDKTARVFRGDGSLLNVLRPPAGPGNGGKLRAVAVSPDGRLVAGGGGGGAGGGPAPPNPPPRQPTMQSMCSIPRPARC
jgi:WD40 repeat protein